MSLAEQRRQRLITALADKYPPKKLAQASLRDLEFAGWAHKIEVDDDWTPLPIALRAQPRYQTQDWTPPSITGRRN